MNKYGEKMCVGFICLGTGPVAISYEHGNEPSVFIKRKEFLELLRDCQLVKQDSFPWRLFSSFRLLRIVQ
jgi:hypothetical protein